MGTHIFNTELNDEQAPCTLELQLQGLNGKDCTVPLGFAEVQRASSPKPDDQIPFVETVELRVFSDASLDINKAKAPEYVPMFKDQKEFQEDEPVGYYYFFVNGYLWREIAAISGGMLSEVDLREYHGQSFRPNNGTHMPRLTLPIRAKGLFSDSTSVETMTYQVAFSRVQWSWDYISALGDMKPDDSRFDKKPMTSKCPDEGKASTYRSERMQTIDFSSAPNWDSIENLKANEDGEPCIYLHDVLGIAQKCFLLSETALAQLTIQRLTLEENGYYKSAIIAQSVFLNDELHEKDFSMRNVAQSRYKPEIDYKQKDSFSRELRSAAAHLSESKVEKYLVGSNSAEILDLVEIFYENKEKLIKIYTENYTPPRGISEPSKLQFISRDFSTLDNIQDHYSFHMFCQHFNLMALRKEGLQVNFKAVLDKARVSKLTSKLDEQYKKAIKLVFKHVSDENEWFQKQFCGNELAYGDTSASAQYDETLIGVELGDFDPKKFNRDEALAPVSMFNLTKGASDISLKGVEEFTNLHLALHKEFIDKQTPSEKLQRFMASTIKSRVPEFVDKLKLFPAGDVPDTHFSLTKEFSDITTLGRLTTRKQHQAFKKIIDAVIKDKVGSKNNNQFITVAKALGLEVFDEKGKVNGVILTKTKESIESLAIKTIEFKKLKGDVNSSTKYVLSLPKELFDLEYEHKELFDELGQGYHREGLTNKELSRFKKVAKKGVPGLIAILTVWGTIIQYSDYEKNFEGKGDLYEVSKNLALLGGSITAILGLLNSTLKIPEEERLLTKEKYIGRVGQSISSISIFRGMSSIIGIAASVVLLFDGLELIAKHDLDAGIATLVSAGFTFLSSIQVFFFGSLGHLGWVLFIAAILTALIAEALKDSKLKRWAEFGPLGMKSNITYEHFKNSEKFHEYILSVLYSPRVANVINNGLHYQVEISSPIIDELESELGLQVDYKYRNIRNLKVYEGTWVYGLKDHKPIYSKERNKIGGIFNFSLDGEILDVELKPFVRVNKVTIPIKYKEYEVYEHATEK
ncbi:hypothetical protein GSF04_13830 [Pseudoalteromonas sp. A22]|uniref:hypothetical protein n=1 Tax=Pseudoalteromonas sp. A22 TaxID=327511 RepID=UPI001BAA5FC7|nr:hypothetical protein [Pseudoalteromonas sp. A22]QUI63519.1 hypothetical protein GSF04_13830 [Pseudoalteromonas sp. A22]